MRHNCNDLTYYAKSTTLLEYLIHLGVLLLLVISSFRADYDQKTERRAEPRPLEGKGNAEKQLRTAGSPLFKRDYICIFSQHLRPKRDLFFLNFFLKVKHTTLAVPINPEKRFTCLPTWGVDLGFKLTSVS